LKALVEHGVDFVLIGGMAGIARGSSYPTYDLDVAYARDQANLERLAKALRELGVTPRGAPADLPFIADAEMLGKGANFTFNTEFGNFDILGNVSGVSAYEELRRDSAILEVEGFPIRVASLGHLISMKRSANRPKDQNMLLEYIDLIELPDPAVDGDD
jgi:predicted nucleotidyltransferase